MLFLEGLGWENSEGFLKSKQWSKFTMMQEFQYVQSRHVTRLSLYPVTKIQSWPIEIFAGLTISPLYLMENVKVRGWERKQSSWGRLSPFYKRSPWPSDLLLKTLFGAGRNYPQLATGTETGMTIWCLCAQPAQSPVFWHCYWNKLNYLWERSWIKQLVWQKKTSVCEVFLSRKSLREGRREHSHHTNTNTTSEKSARVWSSGNRHLAPQQSTLPGTLRQHMPTDSSLLWGVQSAFLTTQKVSFH